MTSPEVMDLSRKEAEMQQRYIELLEKRVAQLELSVASGTPASDDKPDIGKDKADDSSATKEKEKEKEQEKEKDKEKDKDKTEIKRYLNILRKWNKDKGSYDDTEVASDFFAKKVTPNTAYTYRRVYNPDTGDEDAYSELDIEDKTLISTLKTVIGKYTGVNFDGNKISMRSPFAPLVHHWDKLNEHAENDKDSQVSKDLSSLLERVKTSPELEDYFKTREANLKSKVVTFDTLWTIFAPESLVVGRPFQNVAQLFKVHDPPLPWPHNYYSSTHRMWIWGWDYNGKGLIQIQYLHKFDRFRGTKRITELPYYPLEYYDDKEKLLRDSRDRTLEFIKATVKCKAGAQQMFIYHGLAYEAERNLLSSKGGDGGEGDDDHRPNNRRRRRYQSFTDDDEGEARQPKLVQVTGEIIVDHEAFNQYGTGKPPLGAELYRDEQIWIEESFTNSEDYHEFSQTVNKLDVSKYDADSPLDPENDNFLIFPPRVLGYASREKIWGQFFLGSKKPRPPKQREKFAENLQLDDKYKNLIDALVQSHENSGESGQKQVEDLVQDKGKGLVLLLHGPPGVGKTLTAETIAQATAKPLVIVSVAEIGLDASHAERNLERLFKLATKWEAILLVDEADVFLETRGATSDASRNALVSVLLRVLEYYRGIIILTTNRIKHIDIAVISRIHLAIRYQDLTKDQVHSIFTYFLDQLEPGCIEDRAQLDDFIDVYGSYYELNGRQIRNVVAAALAAARHRKGRNSGKITIGDLRSVCDMTRQFQEQLKDITSQQRTLNEAGAGRAR
ncbi:transitional endoplasmic reticulum ATPase 1 [Cladorrhinum sp. PSN332]|nr:transitional endoplasmic reticulum ATPase 1 [Cladorrhinum sp. PSN332]